MITLRDIQLRYGQRTLYGGLNVAIGARDRIGLAGSNGAGKSTLLKVLTGEVQADAGAIEKSAWVSIGYLPQEGIRAAGQSLYEEASSAFSDIRETERKLEAASQRLQGLEASNPEYMDLLEQIGAFEHYLDAAQAHTLRPRVERVLSGLGFSAQDSERDCGEFSGGWQMRIALAKLLLRSPSLLLLDEPTNHLDLESLRWLEQYLCGYQGAMIIVSHDRAFLDALCTRTWALSRGSLEDYRGNFSFYLEQSVARKQALVQAAAKQERAIAQTERFIERFRSKATKATQVQSRIKALEKVERIEVGEDESQISFRFAEPPRSGQTVLELTGITKRYDDLLVYSGLDFRLERGDRVAVVGVNGAGKSTLAKILAGVEPVQAGERQMGYNVLLSYFAQHQADELLPTDTVLESAVKAAPSGIGETKVRNLLGSFLFTGDDAFKKVSVLSGGEKNRLALVRMLLHPVNCLILDEPTNHLDMASKSILQEALKAYSGTLFIVSHDRAFLDPLVTKVVEVRPGGGARVFSGNLSYYLFKIEEEKQRAAQGIGGGASSSAPAAGGGSGGRSVRAQNTTAAGGGSAVPIATGQTGGAELSGKARRQAVAERNRLLAPLRKRSEVLEKNIAAWEAEHAALEQQMADPEFFKQGEHTREKMEHYESLQRKVAQGYAEWENVQQQIEALVAED